MNKFSRTARSVTFAAIVGLSLGVAGPGMVAAPVFAQEVQKANINFEQNGKLTIHKKNITGVDNSDSKAASGKEEPGVKGEGLAGVTFKIEKVNINLHDPSVWATLPKTVEEARAKGISGDVLKKTQETTGPEGNAVFENLPLGIYIVTEETVPQGVIKGAPFLVSLPMTNDKGDAWNYDVHVYPKNTKAEAKKAVEDADKNQNDEIVYKVTTPIPSVTETQKLTKYVIKDDFDQEKVTVDPSTVELFIGNPDEGNKIEPEDYNASLVNSNGELEITFNETGLANLKKSQGKTVVTVIKATMKELGSQNEVEILNKARVIFNNPNSDSGLEDIEIPTNEVRTYLGSVEVTKKDADEKDKVLKGARFELYKSSDQTCDGVGETRILADQNLVTGEDGKLTIKGLHVTNLEDAVKVIDKQYCLKEIEAPAGYAVPTGGAEWKSFKITVDEQKGDGGKITSAKINNAAVQVDNKKTPTPELPMTGGAGVGILAAIGAAIIGAGAWFARRNSAES